MNQFDNMDIIKSSTVSSTSSSNQKSIENSYGRININERFGTPVQNLTITDIFEQQYNLQIPKSTKVVMNLLLRSFSDDEEGLRNLMYFLGADQETDQDIASDFFSFVQESEIDLNELLQYNDSLTQMYMCSLFGIIFSWLRIVNDEFLTEYHNKLNFVVNQPVLVSLFRCQCGGSIFPAKGCYVDGVCTECNCQFELKDHSGRQYTNERQLLNQHIPGGSVNAHKFNELQNQRPWLLLFIRKPNSKFKRLLKIPPNCYEVNYDETFNSKKEYNSTFVRVHTFDELMIEEPIDETIQFLMNSFQTRGNNPCLKKKIRKDTPSSVCLKTILNNLLDRLLIILQRQDRNETLQRVILEKKQKYCQLKSVIQGIITCMTNSEYK